MEEKQKEVVRNEARKILDSFGKTLGKIKVNVKEVDKVGESVRSEGAGKSDADFRDRMFANFPKRDDDFLIAEKAGWN